MTRILALNGGGMAGYATARYLGLLEGATGKPVHQLFDGVVGVSTGAIIGAAMAYTGLAANTVAEAYADIGRKVFHLRRWERLLQRGWLWGTRYRIGNLQDGLYTLFSDLRLSDGQRRCNFMTYAGVVSPRTASRHWKSWDDCAPTTLVRHVVAASCAAQAYFQPVTVGDEVCIDGGNVANNPSMHALADWPDARIFNVQCLSPQRRVPHAAAKRSFVQWARYLVSTANSLDESAVEYQCHKLLGDRYCLQRLGVETDIDDASPEAIATMNRLALAAWDSSREAVLTWLAV